MNTQLNTLIIEDHQLIIDSYILALKNIEAKYPSFKFIVHTAKNCDTANEKMETFVKDSFIDFVLLDISLPPSKDGTLLSGDDLGIKLRKLFPKVKIIVCTHLSDNFRLANILKNIKPNGLLLKTELDFNNLKEAILNVLYDVPHYSQPVLKVVRQHVSNDFDLDHIDRQILYELTRGTKIKELPEIVHLSQGGIEKRHRRLHDIFNNDEKSDKNLLKLARDKGFI